MLKKVALSLFVLLPSYWMTSASFAQAPVYPSYPPAMPPYMQQPMPYYRMPPQPMMAPQGFPQTMPARPLPKTPNTQGKQKPFKEFSGYLGINLDLIPSSVAAQLPKGTSQGQGILVKKFAPNSPGETSDLKPFDVIIAYDDIKIIHPAQFIKLVRDDQPARTVKLKVVRKGEIIDVPVTLGSQQTPNPKEFNGLAIKRIGKNKYQANVRFIGSNGNKQLRSYEGNRQEIFEQALNARDLPLEEREQLLYATRPRQGESNSGFGSFFPFGGKNESGKNWMNPGKFFNF